MTVVTLESIIIVLFIGPQVVVEPLFVAFDFCLGPAPFRWHTTSQQQNHS